MTGTREQAEGIGTQLWGALRHALTEEDPIAAARRAKLQGSRAGESAPAAVAGVAAATPAALSGMAQALLEQVLAKATAYTALTDKLGPLEGIVVDERTRYQAAYALIKGSRSVTQVLQAIDMQHLPALDAEAARFAAQFQDQERAEIDARRNEAQALGTSIEGAAQQARRVHEEAQARIAQIEAGAARERERLALLTQQIEDKRRELASVQQQFDSAAQAVREALAQAREKVLRHLA